MSESSQISLLAAHRATQLRRNIGILTEKLDSARIFFDEYNPDTGTLSVRVGLSEAGDCMLLGSAPFSLYPHSVQIKQAPYDLHGHTTLPHSGLVSDSYEYDHERVPKTFNVKRHGGGGSSVCGDATARDESHSHHSAGS